MTKNALVVFCVAQEDAVMELFLPYWLRAGLDIILSSPIDAPSKLKGVNHVNFGRAIAQRPQTYWHYQARYLDTCKYLLTLDHDGFILSQYDTVVLDKLPYIGPADSVHHMAGGHSHGFKASFFVHPPDCFGHVRLEEFVRAAEKYDIQTTENGFHDRWLSLIIERENLPWQKCSWSWSSNKMDTPQLVASARKARDDGKVFFHGIATHRQLAQLLA